MTEHELQSWLKQAGDNTSPFYDFIVSTRDSRGRILLDDTFGWGGRFREMWNGLKKGLSGLLLTGPNGCGKHTAAAHMYHVLYDTHYALLLDGMELCADGFAAATQRLRYALDHPGKDDQGTPLPWCLILENMESCPCRRELFTWLGQALTAQWYGETDVPPAFFILIDSSEEDIPSVLRRHLRLCRMSLPTTSRRRAYIGRDEFPMIRVAVDCQLLATATEGLTYAQLADLTRNLEATINCLPDDQRSFTERELREFLQEQLPAPAREDPLQSLAQSARQFIERLPELLSLAGSGQISQAPIQVPNQEIIQPPPSGSPSDETLSDRDAFEKEVSDMRIPALCNELFNQDQMVRINAKRTAIVQPM